MAENVKINKQSWNAQKQSFISLKPVWSTQQATRCICNTNVHICEFPSLCTEIMDVFST